MNPFEKELTTYLDQSEARGNKVISINGVRAMLERHQNSVNAPVVDFRSKKEGLSIEERKMLIEASRNVKITLG